MHRRMSPDARAEKFEFNGEMMDPASEGTPERSRVPASETRCLRISSSSSPQHPIRDTERDDALWIRCEGVCVFFFK